MTNRRPKSLLEELTAIAVKHDAETVIESRATHIIDSAINLLSLLRETFDDDVSDELERRFINSIKSGDHNKFTRGIRKHRDNKQRTKNLTVISNNTKK